MTLEIVFVGALLLAIVFGGNWLLAGWSLRGGNGRLLVGILTAWILTTIIGLVVFLAFRIIRKHQIKNAEAAP